MNWRAADIETLQRIMVTLISLALLADRASRAPLPVRLHLLDILFRAETVVREFIFGSPYSPDITDPNQDSEATAADLARRFMLLAQALSIVLTWRCLRHAGDFASGVQADGDVRLVAPQAGKPVGHRVTARPIPDT